MAYFFTGLVAFVAGALLRDRLVTAVDALKGSILARWF